MTSTHPKTPAATTAPATPAATNAAPAAADAAPAPTPSTRRPVFARQRSARTVPRPPGPPPLPEPPAPHPPVPEPPAPTPPPSPTPGPDLAKRRRLREVYAGTAGAVELAVLAGIVIAALAVRLSDITSSRIIGAEDPYRHMERTWDLIQGKGIGDYPPGLAILMAPFALMGPATFYAVARFTPVVFGVGMVVAIYALSRRHLHPAGALTAALAAALVPELVRRTTLLFPTAMDLALVPVLFLAVIEAASGSRKAVIACGALAGVLLASHPWVFVLVLPPIAVYWIGAQFRAQWRQEHHGHITRVALAAGLVPVAFLTLWAIDFGDVATRISDNALPRLSAVVSEPSSITPLPLFVDFSSMIGYPLLGLAGLGALAVLLRPTRLGVLSLLYSVMLLPLILVDWFGLWYVPHRTVAYFAIGVCLLAGIAVSEAARRLLGVAAASAGDGAKATRGHLGITLGAVGLTAFLLIPAVSADTTWYTIFDDRDFEAWHAVDDQGAHFVMAGSWQARMGYRATTGNNAVYSPDFFTDQTSRDYWIQQHPDMVVLVDKYTTESGTPTAFLDDTSQWTLIGQWGEDRAYARY